MAEQTEATLPEAVSVEVVPERRVPLPAELRVEHGWLESARQVGRDAAGVRLNLEATERLGVFRPEVLVLALVEIVGVAGEGWRIGDPLWVEPVEPDTSDAGGVRWCVTPELWLVQTGAESLELTLDPASRAATEGFLMMSCEQVRRLAGALVCAGAWVADVARSAERAAAARREQLGAALRARRT